LQGAYAAVGGTLALLRTCENQNQKTLKPYWLKQKSNREGAYYRNLFSKYQHHKQGQG